MTGRRVLLDSVILIDHFNGIRRATSYLKEVAPQACISAITRAEVQAGFETAESLMKARKLLDRFPMIPVDASVADLAAELRREHRWKIPDALQAASAKLYELKLATRNTKDFPPEQHPFVHVPYEL